MTEHGRKLDLLLRYACSAALLAIVVGSAGASPPADSAAVDHIPPTPEEVLRVPPELAEQLQARVTSRALRSEDRWELLTDFFYRSGGLELEYTTQPTLTVAELFDVRRGNCLSFTLTFIALARQAGMEAWAREVRMPLVWTREENLIYGTGHVNAGLHTGHHRMVVDFEPNHLLSRLLASPYRGRRISEERALAHFYNNRGAELLAEERFDPALRYLEQAIGQDSSFTPAWNNLGVLQRRLDHPAAAERAFLTALEHDPENVSALFNIIALYRHSGNAEALAHYRGRIETAHPDDPYYQFEIGRQYEDASDFENAERHYRRAVQLSSEDHRLQFALARANFELGNIRRAERAFEKAMHLTESGEVQNRYQAKLDALRSSHAVPN